MSPYPLPIGDGLAASCRQDERIGHTCQQAPALPPGLHVFDNPFVPDLLPAYLGEPGRPPSALWRPLGGVPQRARLQYARL